MPAFNFHPQRSLVYRAVHTAAGAFPLTLQGTLTLLVAALALREFAYGAMDLVVFALAICALAILVFSLFCTVISGVIIQRRVMKLLQQPAAKEIRLECGFPNESGFSLPALNYFPLIKLTWTVVFPDQLEARVRSEENGTLVEEIIPRKRCLSDTVVRQFTVSDVLGFCRYSWRKTENRHCIALPQINTVRSLPILQSMTAEDGIPNPAGNPDGDRMEIRPYAPGDSVRDIMWKAFARNRQLNVRLAEKSVFHSQKTIAYLLSSSNDEAASAIARVALEQGALGEHWLFGADGTTGSTDSVHSALEAIARSRALAEPHAYGLDDFIQESTGGAAAHCIVFAAAEQADWLPLLQKSMQRFRGPFSLILATDGFSDLQAVPLWQRLLLKSPDSRQLATDTGIKRSDLLGLLTDMGHLVESTLIIERRSGHCFDRQLRRV
jgi:uncharacterized protein (DUF58 family)